MNRILISSALTNVDDLFIAETMNAPEMNVDRAPERTISMKNRTTNIKCIRARQLLRLALAACLIFALAVTAYAFNFLGIREMLKHSGDELPSEAYEYIQTHDMSIDSTVWRCDVTESLTDAQNIYIAVTVTTPGKYILAPADASAESLTSVIGLDGSQTLGEYAAGQKKELLFLSMDIEEREALGITHSALSFESVSPQEVTFLLHANKTESASIRDVVCVVTGVEEIAVRSHHMGITLVEAPTATSGAYVPDEPNGIPGVIVGEATIIETPLGLSIRFMETIVDEAALDNIKKVEFDGMEYREGGLVLEEDGNWYFTVSRCTGEIGDVLTARFYDWDNELIGTVTFNRN